MSIRHYTPRRNKRRGISSKANIFLLFVLSIAVLLQIIYPLIDGEALRLATISAVYWGAGAMSLHALYSYGARYAFTYLGFTLFFAFIVEVIGIRTGWPFGQYSYDGSLGYQILDVPIVVPFAWVMISHPLLIASRRVAPRWVFLYGGFSLMAWDLFLEPQMVSAGRWTWVFSGPHVPYQKEIPLSNAFGWLLSGIALMAILHMILPKERRKIGASFAAVDFFLAWTWFSGVIGNLFFFHRSGVALFGGLVYGIALAPYFISRWLGRP